MDTDHRRFQVANISPASPCVPMMFAPGYFAVRGLGSVDEMTEAHLLGIGLVVAVLTVGATMIGARLLGRVDRKRPGLRTSTANADL
jgi:membrane protein DedA with SNARE-associated domain